MSHDLHKDMEAQWGEQCPDFYNLCSRCVAWALFHREPKIPTVEDVQGAMDADPVADGAARDVDGFRLCPECKTQIQCASRRECGRPVFCGEARMNDSK